MTYPKRAGTEHPENGPLAEKNHVIPVVSGIVHGTAGFPGQANRVYFFQEHH